MEQKTFKKDELKQLLFENECVVDFTKVNGEKRSMPCTLNPKLMPEPPKTESTKEKKENPDVLNVWCTDKNSWRSFRIENIIDVKVKG